MLVDPASVGAELVRTDRGGDVTYHGPGQLVGYPVMSVPMGPKASPCHVHRIEQLIIEVLRDLGLAGAGRLAGYPGVWVDPGGAEPRKICAIGVRVSRGRSMHGFALNVDPDMAYFGHIVPCGIADKPVTSLAAEGFDVPMAEVVDRVVARAASVWGYQRIDRQDVAWQVAAGELAPFTLGAGPGEAGAGEGAERRARSRKPGAGAHAGQAAGRGRGRSRPAGSPSTSANRSGCGSRPGWARSTGRCVAPCASSSW